MFQSGARRERPRAGPPANERPPSSLRPRPLPYNKGSAVSTAATDTNNPERAEPSRAEDLLHPAFHFLPSFFPPAETMADTQVDSGSDISAKVRRARPPPHGAAQNESVSRLTYIYSGFALIHSLLDRVEPGQKDETLSGFYFLILVEIPPPLRNQSRDGAGSARCAPRRRAVPPLIVRRACAGSLFIQAGWFRARPVRTAALMEQQRLGTVRGFRARFLLLLLEAAGPGD